MFFHDLLTSGGRSELRRVRLHVSSTPSLASLYGLPAPQVSGSSKPASRHRRESAACSGSSSFLMPVREPGPKLAGEAWRLGAQQPVSARLRRRRRPLSRSPTRRKRWTRRFRRKSPSKPGGAGWQSTARRSSAPCVTTGSIRWPWPRKLRRCRPVSDDGRRQGHRSLGQLDAADPNSAFADAAGLSALLGGRSSRGQLFGAEAAHVRPDARADADRSRLYRQPHQGQRRLAVRT